eukprot:767903-Hanusia_phi.AAC.5
MSEEDDAMVLRRKRNFMYANIKQRKLCKKALKRIGIKFVNDGYELRWLSEHPRRKMLRAPCNDAGSSGRGACLSAKSYLAYEAIGSNIL